MSLIQILPPELQNQIAAGEVVERPASIVKELMENSLDAGASLIDVQLAGGGQSLIRVQDNGTGLRAEDIPLALTRHATSKLKTISDLQHLQSFGFRGEALPSIASVSRMTISSIVQGAEQGTQAEVEFGTIKSLFPCALRQGTRVEVRDLFLNTPARLKFLKTPAWEGKKCQEMFCKMALANLQAGFSLQVKGKKVIQFDTDQDLKQRLEQIWPRQITDRLIPVNIQEDSYQLTGLIGHPETPQARAGRILFFVNKRPIQDKMLLAALRQGFRGKLLSKEYPQAVLFIKLPSQDVDINVHPAKAEVRFKAEQDVFSLIAKGISQAIDKQYSTLAQIPAVEERHATHSRETGAKFNTFNAYLQETGPEGWTKNEQKGSQDYSPTGETPDCPVSRPLSGPKDSIQALHPSLDETRQTNNSQRLIQGQQWTFLGQVHKTYLLFTSLDGDKLIILDQHAAHERILFEKLSTGSLQGSTQLLAIPGNFTLQREQKKQLIKLSPYLRKLGFAFTLEGDQIWLEGQPAFLAPDKAKKIFWELLNEQIESIEHILAHIACRQAIKSGDQLGAHEALFLLQDWLSCPKRQFCPHGRPAALDLDRSALEKMFKRTG